MLFVLATAGSIIGVWAVSLVIEAIRPVPRAPQTLRWSPEIPINYLTLGGLRLRYIKTGQGPAVVLLHTLRTQLDLFEKVVPELAKSFTVYAIDYPGHGYSDIPDERYDADFFVDFIARALDALDLRSVTLCGVSIGASIALILAGRGNPRVERVIAINPYDYAGGRGLARGSWLGWLTVATARVPVVGDTFMRFRNLPITSAIFRGGVVNPASFPSALLDEMNRVGNRRGHYRAFLSLLRNSSTWETSTAVYRRITVPVRLIWGEHDWATVRERQKDADMIPGVQMVTVERAGHFLPLDRPDVVVDAVRSFTEGR